MSPQQKPSRRKILQERRLAAHKQRQRNFIILGLVLVGALAFSAYQYFDRPQVSEARLNQSPIRGAKDAVVTITEFGDFGCEACQAWHQAGVLEDILTSYDGQVKLEWRDLPIITSYSQKASEAGQCALDQGKFWEFHDAAFERLEYSALRAEDLRSYAAQAGLDVDQYDQCLASGLHTQTVNFDYKIARDFGFRGTPSFMVNGQPVIGANPDLLVAAIETALANLQ